MMVEKELTIENKLGLHLRPANLLVKEAGKYSSDVTIIKDYIKVSAKSIMGIMALMANKGAKLKIVAEGEDETEAVEGLTKLFENKFFEE